MEPTANIYNNKGGYVDGIYKADFIISFCGKGDCCRPFAIGKRRLVGVNLVLKRFSMLGDGLSHVSFGAAAVGLACGVAPLEFSIPIVIVAAFLLLRLKQTAK